MPEKKNTEALDNHDPGENEDLPEEEIEVQPREDSTDVDAATEAPDELIKLRLELDEYKNLYLRKSAEFENFRKRKQQEFRDLILSAEESLITSLLPILDDFDRVEINGSADPESLTQGVKLIREKLWNALSARGVTLIESVGKPFDPQLHEAILQQEEEGKEPDIVIQEHQRGYRLGKKVIRHSQVVVSA